MNGWARTPRGLLRPRGGGPSRGGPQSPQRRGGRRDLLRITLFAFIVMAISTIHAHIGILAAVRPGILIWLMVLVSLLLVPNALRWRNLTDTWQAKAIVALAAFACLSIPFGLSIGQAGSYFIDVYSRVLVLGGLLILATRDVEDLSLFIWAYVVAAALLIWLAFFGMDVAAARGSIERIQSTVKYDSNDLGVILSTGFALSLITFHTSGRWGKRLSLAVLLGIPATIALTGSRGAFVGFASVGLGLLLTVRTVPVGKRVLVLGAALIAITVFAPPGYWARMGTLLSPTEDYNYTDVNGRRALTTRGLGYMMQYPVFGLGINNFQRAEYTISEKARVTMEGVGVWNAAPHNTYVQVGADMGLPALLIWISLLGSGTVGVIRLRRRIPASWARSNKRDEAFLYWVGEYLPAAFIGFAVPSAFVSHAYVPQFYLLVAFLVGFQQAVVRRVGVSRDRARRPLTRRRVAQVPVRGWETEPARS